MANRGPHGKAPVGAGRGKMDFKVLGRLMKQVFHDYPVHLTVVVVCIVLTALINVAPAAPGKAPRAPAPQCPAS